MDEEYFFIQAVHLHRLPSRPHEVGIPIQYLQSAASSLSGTPVAQPLATKAPRPPAVRIACLSCRKASRKCSESRPCGRCIQRGIADTCVDAPSAKGRKVMDAPSTTITADADLGPINDYEPFNVPPVVDSSTRQAAPPQSAGIGPEAPIGVTPDTAFYTYPPNTSSYQTWTPTAHQFGGDVLNAEGSSMSFMGLTDTMQPYATVEGANVPPVYNACSGAIGSLGHPF